MIGYLKGKVISKKGGFLLILTAGGVGYKVSVPFGVFDRIFEKEEAELFIYLNVREDILALYGFQSQEEIILFEKIIGVSGIGPKAGLAIISSLGKDKLLEAIDGGNPAIIVSVPGVGKKTAERLVLELAGKLERAPTFAITDDTYDALMSLGYSAKEAGGAVKRIDKSIVGTEDRVKEALKIIRE